MARHEQGSRLSSVQQARRSRRSPAPRRPLYIVEEGPPPPQRWPTAADGVAEWQGRQPIGCAAFERGGKGKKRGRGGGRGSVLGRARRACAVRRARRGEMGRERDRDRQRGGGCGAGPPCGAVQ